MGRHTSAAAGRAPTSNRRATLWGRARRPLALAVVLFGSLALGLSAYTGFFRICKPQALVVGDHLIQSRLCDPLSFSDLAPL